MVTSTGEREAAWVQERKALTQALAELRWVELRAC